MEARAAALASLAAAAAQQRPSKHSSRTASARAGSGKVPPSTASGAPRASNARSLKRASGPRRSSLTFPQEEAAPSAPAAAQQRHRGSRNSGVPGTLVLCYVYYLRYSLDGTQSLEASAIHRPDSGLERHFGPPSPPPHGRRSLPDPHAVILRAARPCGVAGTFPTCPLRDSPLGRRRSGMTTGSTPPRCSPSAPSTWIYAPAGWRYRPLL